MNLVFLYVTTKNAEEAEKIGRVLVEERLVACVNIMSGINSIYRWQGKIEEGGESVFIAKTKTSLADKTISRIKELHSYKCPCIVALPIVAGNTDYLHWLSAETQ